MAQPIVRKKCTVTAEVIGSSITLTPTTNAKSPAVNIGTIVVNYTGTSTADFFGGSGRFNVIFQRM